MHKTAAGDSKPRRYKECWTHSSISASHKIGHKEGAIVALPGHQI